MRLSSAFTIFCLVVSASPSLATSSFLSERIVKTESVKPVGETTAAASTDSADKGATTKAVIGGVMGTLTSVIGATFINSIVAWFRANHTARRDAFEFLDTQINEELAARAHQRRELLTRLLNDLD